MGDALLPVPATTPRVARYHFSPGRSIWSYDRVIRTASPAVRAAAATIAARSIADTASSISQAGRRARDWIYETPERARARARHNPPSTGRTFRSYQSRSTALSSFSRSSGPYRRMYRRRRITRS